MAEARARFTLAARDKTRGPFSTVRRGLNGLGRMARGLSGALGKVGVAIGALGIGAVVGVVALMNKFAESSDNAGKKARRFGLDATEALGHFRFAAERSGVAAATFDMGFQRMGRRIGQVAESKDTSKLERKLAGLKRAFAELSPTSSRREPMADRIKDVNDQIAEARAGAGEAKVALDALGLSGKKLAAMIPEQQFLTIMKALDGVANPNRQAFLTQKLFDSEGVAMLQMLEGGYDSLSKTIAEGARLGAGVTDKQSLAAADYNDALLDLKTSGAGFIREVITPLYPFAVDVLKPMTEALVRMKNEGFDVVFHKMLDHLPAVLEHWRTFSNGVSSLIPVFESLGRGIMNAFEYFGSPGFRTTLETIGWIGDKLGTAISLPGRVLGGAAAAGGAALGGNGTMAAQIAAQTARDFVNANAQLFTGNNTVEDLLGQIVEVLKDGSRDNFAVVP
jgi:hypothetical protein